MKLRVDRLSPWESLNCKVQFKQRPEDFIVTEVPKYKPQGEGEHLWLWVQKRDANTDWVADQIAKLAKVKRRDVSYAGRKDRFAVTQQWFSIYDPRKSTDQLDFSISNVKVLKKIRHQQKLKTGVLNGNHFQIVLRDVKTKNFAE